MIQIYEYISAHAKEMLAKTLPIILTVVLVVFLLSYIRISDVIAAFNEISLHYIVMGLILYVFIYCLRTLRFQILLNNKLRFKELFVIVCLHNLMNNIMPARAGEFSYLYLVKKSTKNISAGESIASLLLVRLFDIIGISIIFLTSALMVEVSSSLHLLKIIATVLIGIVMLLLFCIVLFGDHFVCLVTKVMISLKIDDKKIVAFLQIKLKETIESLNIINNPRIIIYTLVLSILINFSMFLIGYLLIYGLGIHIGIFEIFVAGTVALFTTVLPIQGFLNFGTMEAGFAMGFSLFNVPKEISIAIGFSYHIILIVYLIILGGYGLYKSKLFIKFI